MRKERGVSEESPPELASLSSEDKERTRAEKVRTKCGLSCGFSLTFVMEYTDEKYENPVD